MGIQRHSSKKHAEKHDAGVDMVWSEASDKVILQVSNISEPLPNYNHVLYGYIVH